MNVRRPKRDRQVTQRGQELIFEANRIRHRRQGICGASDRDSENADAPNGDESKGAASPEWGQFHLPRLLRPANSSTSLQGAFRSPPGTVGSAVGHCDMVVSSDGRHSAGTVGGPARAGNGSSSKSPVH